MYRFRFFLSFFLVLGVFGGCSTDVDVNAPYKETKILYSFIDPTEPFQIARISKGFQNEGRSAYDIAKNSPDSSLYGPGILKVELIELNNKGIKRVFAMYDTIIQKDTGLFYSPNQVVFKTPNFKVDTGSKYLNISYKIRITNTKTGSITEAETPLVGRNFDIITPIRELSNDPFIFTFLSKGPTSFKIQRSTNAGILQAFIYWKIRVTKADNTIEDQTWNWSSPGELTFQNEGALAGTATVFGSNFFQFIRNEVSSRGNEGVVSRQFLDGEIEVWAASEQFKRYREVYNNYNSLTQSLPSYTNVTNGLGLMASINHIKYPVRLNRISQDTLKEVVPDFKLVR